MDMPDFTGMAPDAVVSYCRMVLGVPERTQEEWEAYYRDLERKEKEEQERLKEWYSKGEIGVYKKSCPVCGMAFYTQNERRIYDDYYKCSRYKHRENAKNRRRMARATKCEVCGKVFTPQRAGAKYCCSACKQKAYRQKHDSRDQNDHTP